MILEAIHRQCLEKAAILTSFQVKNPIDPLAVISVLNRNAIRFVLIGLYAFAGWMKEPRASADVDVIVPKRQHNKAVNALECAFPQLKVDDHATVTRLREHDSHGVGIDVMKPNRLYRAAFKHSLNLDISGRVCQIPELEMALALSGICVYEKTVFYPGWRCTESPAKHRSHCPRTKNCDH
jgi:hypothetical protein